MFRVLTRAATLLSIIFFPTASLVAATPVNCGAELSAPGNYELTGDLACNTDPGVLISSDDVSLDLGGNHISCSDLGNSGIVLQDVSDAKVENGEVSGCNIGVSLDNANNSKISYIYLHDNIAGIFMLGANDNQVSENRANNNLAVGIRFENSHRNRFASNETNDNASSGLGTTGLFGASNDNSIDGNTANRNFRTGIFIGGPSTGNIVRDNVANENENDGIALFGFNPVPFFTPIAAGNTVKGNTALGNLDEDLMEALFDLTIPWPPDDPDTVVEPCMNEWKNNIFGESQGPEDCIK